ncbi:toxin VasX [uncultured Psychrobacter sp.]|uniref:toxin VasX n=1 Tax=uncultured Psychrobacter sp. TaxID=259303 RepID=UPI003459E599
MSSDLSFMDRLTRDHNETHSNRKSERVVLELEYEIPTQSDVPSTTLDMITVIATKSCPYGCGKTGIPILPVVLSKTDYRISSRDERYFSHSITSIPSSHNAVASLPNHAYLYCYIENSKGYYFEEYYTSSDGALKKLQTLRSEDFKERSIKSGQIDIQNIDESTNDSIDEEVQPFNCKKANHSTLDSKFITFFQGDIAWLMISHAKLSKSTLRKYIDNEGLRNKRMQKFIADDLTGNENTINMSMNETGYIKSFSRRKQLAQGKDIASRVDVLEQSGGKDISGGTIAATALYRSMERSIAEYDEALALEIKPMMVALPDPVGEVIAAAEKRNYLLKKLDDAQKDKGKVREQVNAIIIDNIKCSIELGTGYDSSKPQSRAAEAYHITGRNSVSQANNKNIYNYIDEVKFKEVLAAAKKSRQDKADVAAARQVFVDAIGYDKNKQDKLDFAFIMREDFLEDDEDSHAGYCQIIAEAIQGIGIDESNIGIPDAIWADYKPEQVTGMTAKQEFEQSLLLCISGEQPIEDNWLIKALIGLNQEDINRMQDAPTFENLARASDFIGTATNWAMAFKAQKQKQKIKANIARDIQRLNDLANYKAQVVQMIISNMSHIKDNNKWLYRVDLWTQATVHQATGFKLAQRVLKYSPEAILKWSEQRLSRSINKAKPHQTLLPASIDSKAISSAPSTQAPIAIDLVSSHGVDQKALDIFDKAASGNKYASTIVTMYASEDIARTTQTINEDITRQVAQLNSDLDPINGQYQRLERQSAGKAALVSAGIGVFQLRSIWIGKNSLGSMAARGDRYALEFMSGYASTTLALTTASLDVVNAGLQVNPARGIWVAKLSLSIGLLGAVGAGFEVYSLELSQQRMKESGSTTSVDAITIAQGAAVIAGVAGAMIGLSISLPFLGAIVAVAWGVSLFAQWIAFKYDKSNILPIHYWLDAGVFGNKQMVGDDYPNNPFSKDGKSNMHTLEHDLKAYVLSMTQVTVTPVFTKKVIDFRETLSGKVEVTINQFNANSYVAVDFIKDDNASNSDISGYTIEALLTQNRAIINEEGILKLTLDIPTVSHYEPSYLTSGMAGTYDTLDNKVMKQAKKDSQSNPSAETKKLKVMVIYELNPGTYPHYLLRTSVTSQ